MPERAHGLNNPFGLDQSFLDGLTTPFQQLGAIIADFFIHPGTVAPPKAPFPFHGDIDTPGTIGTPGTISTGGFLITHGPGTISGTTVTTPIALGDGNHLLFDNEANAVITGGNGNNIITELAAGATITLGNGNNVINDHGAGAIVTTGTGDQAITLHGSANVVSVGPTNGGTHDVTFINAGSGAATVTAGAGNMNITVAGTANVITAGSGHDVFHLNNAATGLGDAWSFLAADFDHWFGHGGSVAISATGDTLTLGNGTNRVDIAGSGNTVRDGSGTDTINGAQTGNNTLIINAAGGTQFVSGFSLTNGDTIDLSQLLAGQTIDASNIGTFITLTATVAPLSHGGIDTTLTITGTGGTDMLTLINSGSIALADLTKGSFIV